MTSYLEEITSETKKQYPGITGAYKAYIECVSHEHYLLCLTSYHGDNTEGISNTTMMDDVYEIELEKNLFSSNSLAPGTIIYIFCDEKDIVCIKQDRRTWAPEDLEAAKYRAQELCKEWGI